MELLFKILLITLVKNQTKETTNNKKFKTQKFDYFFWKFHQGNISVMKKINPKT